MNPMSRRTFLATTGVAAGAIGASSLLAGTAAAADVDRIDDTATHEPVIARVRNAATGEIRLYVGEDEINVVDRVLARRLIRLTH